VSAGQAEPFVSSPLPPVVRRLIRRHVRSVGELELLMLLHAERDRSWRVDEICEALGCPRSWAITQLEAMAGAGLLQPDDGEWRFAAASPELEHATEALQEAYRLHSREVVRFVFATPGHELKAFSDAFRVRREDG
jgi:hypothetical protein